MAPCASVFYKVCIFQVTGNIWLQIYKTIYFLERFKTDFDVILYVPIPQFLVMLFFVWKRERYWTLTKGKPKLFLQKLVFSRFQRKIFFSLSVYCLIYLWFQGLIHCVNAVLCFKQLQEEEVVLLVVEEAEGVEEVEEGEGEDDLICGSRSVQCRFVEWKDLGIIVAFKIMWTEYFKHLQLSWINRMTAWTSKW